MWHPLHMKRYCSHRTVLADVGSQVLVSEACTHVVVNNPDTAACATQEPEMSKNNIVMPGRSPRIGEALADGGGGGGAALGVVPGAQAAGLGEIVRGHPHLAALEAGDRHACRGQENNHEWHLHRLCSSSSSMACISLSWALMQQLVSRQEPDGVL